MGPPRTANGRVLWLDGRQTRALAVYLTEARRALVAATGKEDRPPPY